MKVNIILKKMMDVAEGSEQDEEGEEIEEDKIEQVPVTTVEMFSILGNERRILLAEHVSELHEKQSISTDNLSERVASDLYKQPIDKLGRDQKKRIYVSLYQTHIDIFADNNLIEYDEDNNQISKNENTDIVVEIIEEVRKRTIQNLTEEEMDDLSDSDEV